MSFIPGVAELNKVLEEIIPKLSAHCSDCVHVSEINWRLGSTPLSGHCPSGNQDIINYEGSGTGLYKKRRCPGYELSSDLHQAEKVEAKIREGTLKEMKREKTAYVLAC